MRTQICNWCKKGFQNRHPQRFCSRLCSCEWRKGQFTVRFWANIRKTDSCWVWLKGKFPYGYGVVRCPDGKGRPTHRVSWEMHFGHIPKDTLVCHHCDNPPCVRPDHLFLGTSLDNATD